MFPIVNARGVPGSVGAVVRVPDHGLCLLTCQHVLFGRGAGVGDRVWLADDREGKKRVAEVGRTVSGTIGRVMHEDEACFIDCALAALYDESRLPSFVLDAIAGWSGHAGTARAAAGTKVRKNAWLSGLTAGMVADAAYYDTPFIHERMYEAPGQILVRPANPEECFSAAGESGAAVLDDDDCVVGFLWGLNPSGEGVAFPALAALRHLGATLHRASQDAPLLACGVSR